MGGMVSVVLQVRPEPVEMPLVPQAEQQSKVSDRQRVPCAHLLALQVEQLSHAAGLYHGDAE